MNQPVDPNNIKFHVTQRPLGEGQVRIEFRRWPGDLSFRCASTVHESQVEEEMQKFQKGQEGKLEREREIDRQLYGAPTEAPTNET